MQWGEAIVHTTTQGSDIVSDLMMRFGATGTEIVDRADVPDPNQPGVYWELYDPQMLADFGVRTADRDLRQTLNFPGGQDVNR